MTRTIRRTITYTETWEVSERPSAPLRAVPDVTDTTLEEMPDSRPGLARTEARQIEQARAGRS